MTISDRWVWDHLMDDIEAAIRRGYRRAHKHDDAPTEDAVVATIQRDVTDALSALLEMGDT